MIRQCYSRVSHHDRHTPIIPLPGELKRVLVCRKWKKRGSGLDCNLAIYECLADESPQKGRYCGRYLCAMTFMSPLPSITITILMRCNTYYPNIKVAGIVAKYHLRPRKRETHHCPPWYFVQLTKHQWHHTFRRRNEQELTM